MAASAPPVLASSRKPLDLSPGRGAYDPHERKASNDPRQHAHLVATHDDPKGPVVTRAGGACLDAEVAFGARVRALRKARRWTQDEVAFRLGRERSTVARIESAGRPTPLGEVYALADLFSVPVEDLVHPGLEAGPGCFLDDEAFLDEAEVMTPAGTGVPTPSTSVDPAVEGAGQESPSSDSCPAEPGLTTWVSVTCPVGASAKLALPDDCFPAVDIRVCASYRVGLDSALAAVRSRVLDHALLVATDHALDDAITTIRVPAALLAWLGERLTALAVDEDDVEDRQEWIVGRR